MTDGGPFTSYYEVWTQGWADDGNGNFIIPDGIHTLLITTQDENWALGTYNQQPTLNEIWHVQWNSVTILGNVVQGCTRTQITPP